MKDEQYLPPSDDRSTLEDLNHLIEFLKNTLDVYREQLDRGFDPSLVNQGISSTLKQISAIESEKKALLKKISPLNSSALESVEESCFYGEVEVDYLLKEKWDKHIENWLTDENYKFRIATDCVFRNFVVPGYKEKSFNIIKPINPGEKISYSHELAETQTSKARKEVLLFTAGISFLGILIFSFSGVNNIAKFCGLGLLGFGGIATVGVVTTKVDDSDEAAEEREKAQKEKERLEAHAIAG